MAFYGEMRETAQELLNEFGKPVTLGRTGENAGNYAPTSGDFTGAAPVSLGGTGVLVAFNRDEIDGTQVTATDRKLIYVGDPLEVGDTFDGYRIHSLNVVDPDESGTIVTIAQVRR